ncbi:glycogen debranching N-terminal domain-containing protein [Bradyrhizobium sp. LHD-71]|uniref:amylo-alpha-1,6-glucosidase n=1 Tax=Bradyrhizobium sp. LHD-71 TaxID=3072141 RepID=UPI0028109334|nr:glycogen debranching N-terminal domain-containing protein [Bradyrhizobium sp. LHD-71]MDQ8726678.1 glycogen debranching N-terminal domain-containing protein [Bradyrhizobium sp. LHD-71]
MDLEITVGPPQLALHQGHTVLITDRDGQVTFPSDKGLYFFDTRLISSWSIWANGEPWDLLNSGNITHYASRVFLTNRKIPTEDGGIPERTLGLVLSRSVDGGIHEDIDLVNHGKKPVRFNLEIAIRSDFADLFEVKSGRIVRRGRITTEWSDAESRLSTVYRNQDFSRELTVLAKRNLVRPVYANGRISFEVNLPPGGVWHSCLLYELGNGKIRFEAPAPCIANSDQSTVGQRLARWRQAVPRITTGNEEFYRLYRQAIEDMAALRLPTDRTDEQFVVAAGVPWFVALFGRDSLIASLQTAPVYSGFACAALDVLGALQATERDDYRDAEPGKIMHELRLGELAHFKLVPHTPYYGTADATILYLIVLHVAWRCTGDAGLLERHLKTAEGCLQWIDQYGDRDGDGFQEYATRSPVGYENQGWKDSGDSVVYPDGTLVKGPKALCELQGYVYDAWLRMAEVYDALGNPGRAQELRAKAETLFRRFNDSFWDEASGFYAYALDGDKKKVLSVVSNPGHCLWSGIVPADRARRVVERLMRPDMWSGWGIRTLSANHPAYNPYSYQNGSVWPHDNGIIAMGFRRYGFAEEANRVARDVSGAARYFMLHQVPELYSGVQRDPTDFPVQYLGANVPQAWAAGSALMFLQIILGFQPDAPQDRLYIDPELPGWLPDLTVTNLRVGKRSFDLRLWRDGEKTRWVVLKGDPNAVVARSYASGSSLAIEDSVLAASGTS